MTTPALTSSRPFTYSEATVGGQSGHITPYSFVEAPRYSFRMWIVGLLCLGAAASYPFDVLLAKFFMSDPFPGEIRGLIHKTEFFGHAYGIMGIAFTIYLICSERRRQLPRLLCTALAAGVACDVVKLLIHRVRPVDFSFAADAATFKGLSFLHANSFSQIFDSSLHSFPSAHTATAVAFAMALGAMFPSAARWFLVIAVTCAASRFDGGAHYVSDTFVGGMLGYSVACWMLVPNCCRGRFRAYELGLTKSLFDVATTQRPATAPAELVSLRRTANPKEALQELL